MDVAVAACAANVEADGGNAAGGYVADGETDGAVRARVTAARRGAARGAPHGRKVSVASGRLCRRGAISQRADRPGGAVARLAATWGGRARLPEIVVTGAVWASAPVEPVSAPAHPAATS